MLWSVLQSQPLLQLRYTYCEFSKAFSSRIVRQWLHSTVW